MVGVPGRSKGCSTCRKRKKGCDRRRPTCTQCSTMGIECGGYERETIFLNHTLDPQGTGARHVPIVYQKGAGHAPGSATDITLPRDLERAAYVEKYIGIFMAKYLPTHRAQTTDRLGPSRDWIEIAYGFHTSDKATQLSLLSFGLFATGEARYAIQSYCYALRELHASLSVPGRVQDDSTLATCQLLALFELFHGADKNELLQGLKWHKHLDGLLAIVFSRGPHAYQSGASHRLFADGRYPLLVSAIKNRQRFPLNSPEWRTIPWEIEPKSLTDRLYDTMADLSEVLADTDEMRYCRDPVRKSGMQEEVLKACRRLDESLQRWLNEAGPLVRFHDDRGELIVPTGPSELLLAHMTLLYWTIHVILYSTIISIHEPPLSTPPADIDPLPYLRCVANALPYFWLPGTGMSGPNMAALSWGICLHISYATPERYPEEIALFEQLIFQPGYANSVLPFLKSLQISSGGLDMVNLDGKEGMAIRAQRWLMG